MEMSLKRKSSEKNQDGAEEAKRTKQDMDIRQLNHTVHAGSRKSMLAVIQTKNIVAALKEKNPDMEYPIETMQTLGDSILHLALPKIGEKGLFTKELESALSEKRVDFLVHSLKDLPTTMPEGMALGAVYKRDDPHDCVLFHSKHKGKTLSDLPPKSIVGTSSLRRVAQLKRIYPELTFQSVRGNLNTRLRKMEEESLYDAIVLAKAGIDRMGWADKVGQILKDEILYAVGQGAVAVEIRSDDTYMMEMFGELTDVKTLITVCAERSFMRKLNGGCSTPVGCYAKFEDGKFSLRGICLSVDGLETAEAEVSSAIRYDISRPDGEQKPEYTVSPVGIVIDKLYEEEYLKAEKLGEDLANRLLELGAEEILRVVRQSIPQVSNIQLPVRSDTMKL